MKTNKLARYLLIGAQWILCSLLILLVCFFGWQFIFHYNLEYNDMGRYFDEEASVVYHEQAIFPYGFLFFISSVVLILMSRWALKTKRRKGAKHKIRGTGQPCPKNAYRNIT